MSLTLITIPISHYCEKARWALDRAGISYREEGHAPLLSRLAVARHRLWSTVPVLVSGEGALSDSTVILRHADRQLPPAQRLFPDQPAVCAEVEQLEEELDRRLGPHSRRLAYHFVLPDRDAAVRLLSWRIPALERAAMPLLFPVARQAIRRGLKVNEEGVRRSRERLAEVFAEVGRLLADGRRFLCGDRFTAADLTWAALAAPLVLPAEYPAPLPTLASLPPEVADEVKRFRSVAAGQHALRIYAEERHRLATA